METPFQQMRRSPPSASATPRASLSVIVPVYNSVATLRTLVERLLPVLAEHADEFEIILVNDGSQDESWELIQALAAETPSVRGVDMMRNYGQHNALLCGIREARYELSLTVDDDLQHPPEEIPKLLAAIREGYDVVYGTPEQEMHGIWRNLAKQITRMILQGAMGAEVARNISAFRVLRTDLRRAFVTYQSPFVSIDVLLTWATRRFTSVRTRRDARRHGGSTYTFRKLVVQAVNMMTGFSTIPLQFASLIGFALTLFGIGILVLVVVRYFLAGGSVPGFPFLASIIAIFSGAQLFALGIIGEYIARIHFRMMERPVYTVRTSTHPAASPDGASRTESPPSFEADRG